MHPFFNYPGLWEGVTYNIATIRLPFSATLNDYVQPIRLPRLSDTRTYEKMEGTVTTGDYQYGLYYLRNQVMSNADCQRDILHHLIPDQQMCTDTYIGGAFNSRRYGAPLTIEDGNGRVLVGLADFWKWTPNSYPTRFVRVAYFRDWIQTNTDYIFQF
uniref:Peptidase S1 domain-containing protein n=1 Tax=Anopheles epiroticus TaxID=199890 RepID=A0A182PHH9_9DIPT